MSHVSLTEQRSDRIVNRCTKQRRVSERIQYGLWRHNYLPYLNYLINEQVLWKVACDVRRFLFFYSIVFKTLSNRTCWWNNSTCAYNCAWI